MTHYFFLTTATAITLTAGTALAQTTHPVTGEALSDDQTFSYSVGAQFPTLDPQMVEETTAGDVLRQLFEGLVRQDENGEIIPAGATEWTIDESRTIYTFTLRDDAKWSNGDPVTADDFVYAWRRAVDPETASPNATDMSDAVIVNAAQIIAGEAEPDALGVKAVDAQTLEVTLEHPLSYFPKMLISSTFLPVHQPTLEEFDRSWTAPGNMVSNGAYVLDELALNEYFHLEKNPQYHDADNVLIEEVTGYIINDRNQSLARWEAGEFDYMDDIPAGSYPRLEAEMPDVTYSLPLLCSYFYVINHTDTGNPALQDVRVRTALSYMVNRNVLTEQVLQAGQLPAYNLTPVTTAGFEVPEIDYATWSQEERMAQALALMEEAGYGPDNPIDLNLIYNTSDAHRAIATVFSQMVKPLSVNITLSNYEWQSYLEIKKQQRFDLARMGWCGTYNEASSFLSEVTTDAESNDGRYSNEEVDRLVLEAQSMDDPQEAYTRIEQIMAEDMAIIPLYHYTVNFMLDASIRNWPMNNIEQRWYVQDMYRAAE